MMNEQQFEKLSAYLLGVWDDDQSESVAALVRSASPEERLALQDLLHVLKALPYTLEQHAPPAALKQKILALAGQEQPAHADTAAPSVQLWKNWKTQAATEELVVQRRDEGAWEATGVEGVEVKRLFADAARGYVTMLVRMAAGSSYPSHRHAGYEECYVLQGDLSVGDAALHAGDYQRAEGGSIHVVQSTKNGCLLFIVSSQHDELLA